MDAVLAEVYSTVLPAVPYVVGAYVGILLVLGVYVLMLACKAKQTRDDIEALKDALDARERSEA